MEHVIKKCQTQGTPVDVTDEELVLVLIERSDRDIAFTRLRCPLCQTIEMHPVDTDDEDFDASIEFAVGPYTDFEALTLTRDPSIFNIEVKQGVLNQTKARPIIEAIRKLDTPAKFIGLKEEIENGDY